MATRFWLLPLAIIPGRGRSDRHWHSESSRHHGGWQCLPYARRRILLLVAIVADESECALPDLRREQPIHQPECDAHGSTRRPHDGRSSPTHVIRYARNSKGQPYDSDNETRAVPDHHRSCCGLPCRTTIGHRDAGRRRHDLRGLHHCSAVGTAGSSGRHARAGESGDGRSRRHLRSSYHDCRLTAGCREQNRGTGGRRYVQRNGQGGAARRFNAVRRPGRPAS